MTSKTQYSASAPVIPVAVPLPVQVDNNDTPTALARPTLATANAPFSKSNYILPSSRSAGVMQPVPESRIQQLESQGYTRGLAKSLAQTIKKFPLRIWVVDNSGSMQATDGHRFVETKKTSNIKIASCSRWNEIKDCVEYHCQMAAALEAPTTFRMLNDPGCGPGSQQFGIAETSLDPRVLQEEVHRGMAIMKTAQPGGVTPLIDHITEIREAVSQLAPKLRSNGTKVSIILATDGLPTDARGYGGTAIQQQFVHALRSLESLPVWLVVRLCTDEDSVVEFYNDLDNQLELSMEVLDDFMEEAKGVNEHNPWLNYALPLHRLREMGYHHRVFDMLDERSFTHEEVREFCNLVLVEDNSRELPDPSEDWDDFSREVKRLLAKQKNQWNPIDKKVTPWIDMRKMEMKYGEKKWYHIF